ncbi:hypothetical protein nbrc107696_36640 [Gordonia spumicola]|uniref:DoxX family protein n=1 Tax=Gordonia spumicola TaxID=589161 RepID=A0A7I9VCX6_9ACTN|nr:DoxX family protein [Gordonia spumicola]GEE03218.1 hypothetical protein nbrc107696_36640 [Gordonia spumicola]
MIIRRIARPLLGTAFIASGVDAVIAPSGPARTAEPLLDGVSADAETVIRVAGAVQVGAGLALAFGKAPRISSTVLVGTLVPTTVFASDFWNENDPAVRSAKQSAFVKNLGLLGGALITAADTEGRPSLGWRGRKRLAEARESIADALPGDSGPDRLTAAVDKAEGWAHRAADRVPTDAIAANVSSFAESARSHAEDIAHTVADRAPDVVDATRDFAAQAGDTVTNTTRRWRRTIAS